MKKNLILGILFVSSLAFVGCTPTQRGAGTGAAAGAAIGALAAGRGKRFEPGLVGDLGGQAQLNRIIIDYQNARHPNPSVFTTASNRVPFWEQDEPRALRGD